MLGSAGLLSFRKFVITATAASAVAVATTTKAGRTG